MKKRLLSILLVITLMISSAGFAFGAGNNTKARETTGIMDVTPSLFLEGALMKVVVPRFTKAFCSFANVFMDIFMAGKHFSTKVNCEEKYLTRDDGSKLRVCIYTPKVKKSNMTGLLWIHGGGYALGCPEQDIDFIEDFIEAENCVIVAPDYRNSTTDPYPAAFDDCYRTLLWLRHNGKNYGMREDQIFVGGNSAGGGLCAAVTLAARDTGDVNVAFQMPLYPMLDDRSITPSSQNSNAPVWDSDNNKRGWKLYLGKSYGTDKVSKYAAPARETDYSDLPPTLTFVGDIEPFYDETVIYVDNLRKAGVDVKFKVYEGCFHAFDLFSYKAVAKDARKFLIDGFSYAVDNYFVEQK